MERFCMTGETDLRDFSRLWDSRQPAWLVLHCKEGEALLSLQFRHHAMSAGMMTVITNDMFPALVSRSADFKAFFCLIDRNSAEQATAGIPNEIFNEIYYTPMVDVGSQMDIYFDMLSHAGTDDGNLFHAMILDNSAHNLLLAYFNIRSKIPGTDTGSGERRSADIIIMKFYNLVSDHSREHRDTAFYADKLCITPCYLAMITRQICHETPKQAIDRYVVMEIKRLLINTSWTAKEIAIHMHFNDTSYMCRYFRRNTGESLSGFRKAIAAAHPDT